MKQERVIDQSKLPENAHFLDGIGSCAWFSFGGLKEGGMLISRYNEYQELDFSGIYTLPEGFKPAEDFSFDYDCNCSLCHIVQKDKRFKVTLIKPCKIDERENTSSSQMVHLA